MSNPYETSELLGEYMLFHYGSDEDVMPWSNGPKEGLGFAVRTVSELIDPSTLGAEALGLDVGCAVGRSTFAEKTLWFYKCFYKRLSKVFKINF